MPSTSLIKENLNLKVALLSGIVILLGFGISFFGSSLEDNIWRNFAATVGTTIASLGVISLVYDLILRRSIHAELISLVGIQADLHRNQISGAGRLSEIRWSETINSSSEFHLYLNDPLGWIDANWSEIARKASERSIALVMHLPDPDDEYTVKQVATHLHVPAEEYAASLRRASRTLEQNWTNALQLNNIKKKSRISIVYTKSIFLYGVINTENASFLLFDPPLGKPAGTEPFYICLRGSQSDYPREWLLRHLRIPGNTSVNYENEVE